MQHDMLGMIGIAMNYGNKMMKLGMDYGLQSQYNLATLSTYNNLNLAHTIISFKMICAWQMQREGNIIL